MESFTGAAPHNECAVLCLLPAITSPRPQAASLKTPRKHPGEIEVRHP